MNQFKLTLHEAIEFVLKKEGSPLTATEIASAINRQTLYVKKDGTLVEPGQISARVNKYPGLFVKDESVRPHKISLRKH